jgi:hypothetical protein
MPSPTCFTKRKEQPCILFSLSHDTLQGITGGKKKMSHYMKMECLQEQRFSIFETPSEILHSARRSLDRYTRKIRGALYTCWQGQCPQPVWCGNNGINISTCNKGKQKNVQSVLCQDVLKNEWCSIDPLSRCSKEQIMFDWSFVEMCSKERIMFN